MSTLTEQAIQRYHSLGWSVIPISPGDKKPLVDWKKYQRQAATLEQLETWHKRWPSMSLGCVTGAISGVFVIDQDGPGAEDLLSQLPPTAVSITSKGRHYFFKMPETGWQPGCKTRFMPGLDLRGEGGFVVIPPSQHL